MLPGFVPTQLSCQPGPQFDTRWLAGNQLVGWPAAHQATPAHCRVVAAAAHRPCGLHRTHTRPPTSHFAPMAVPKWQGRCRRQLALSSSSRVLHSCRAHQSGPSCTLQVGGHLLPEPSCLPDLINTTTTTLVNMMSRQAPNMKRCSNKRQLSQQHPKWAAA